MPLSFLGGNEFRACDVEPARSPSLTSASTVRSTLPLSPLSTVEFRLSSENPISRNEASLDSKLSPVAPTDAPNTLDGLFTRTGEGDLVGALRPTGDSGGDS